MASRTAPNALKVISLHPGAAKEDKRTLSAITDQFERA